MEEVPAQQQPIEAKTEPPKDEVDNDDDDDDVEVI